ncbi:MAG: hypothetical protein K8F91_12425 [Candidatus Obscuribacterales bacterium]|nr:hypothetical protein [Candidatus Obscuribacterales bacterium]
MSISGFLNNIESRFENGTSKSVLSEAGDLLFDAAYDGLNQVKGRLLKKVYDGQIPRFSDTSDNVRNSQSAGNDYVGGGDFNQSTMVDGRHRDYLLHVPPSYDGKKDMPLVVALHGRGDDASDIAKLTSLSKKADEEGFIVAYPNATKWFGKKSLAAWDTDNGLIPPGADSNDVQLIDRIIDRAKSDLSIDFDRVHLVGFSNGGMLAYLAASEAKNRIASIAVVAGSMSGDEVAPPAPVSILSINGTLDAIIPVAGLEVPCDISGLILPTLKPQAYVRDFWKNSIGANEEPTVSKQGSAVVESFRNSTTGAELKSILINGGSHDWPGAERTKSRPYDPDSQFDATRAIWDFFQSHPKADEPPLDIRSA